MSRSLTQLQPLSAASAKSAEVGRISSTDAIDFCLNFFFRTGRLRRARPREAAAEKRSLEPEFAVAARQAGRTRVYMLLRYNAMLCISKIINC